MGCIGDLGVDQFISSFLTDKYTKHPLVGPGPLLIP